MVVLRGPRVTVRPGRPDDHDAVAALLHAPGVVRWWGPGDAHDIDELVGDTDPDVTVLLIEHAQRVIGLVQFHEEDDPMYRHAGIDVAIHDDHQGRGLGPEAIELVIDHLAAEGHHRIVIDPNAANEPAIKAYERLGFRPVGVMRHYEWSHHLDTWTDGLLMDLLIEERPLGSP